MRHLVSIALAGSLLACGGESAKRPAPFLVSASPVAGAPAVSEPAPTDIRGAVVHRGSLGMPGVPVELRSADGAVLAKTVTDLVGRFRFERAPAKGLRVVANPDGALPEWSETDVEASARFVPFNPADPTRRKITFRVPVDSSPAVTLLRPNGWSMEYPVKRGRETLSIDRRMPGLFAAWAVEGSGAWIAPEIELIASDAELTVRLSPTRTVSGRLLAPDGSPVADADVRLFFDPWWERRQFSDGALFGARMDSDEEVFGEVVTRTDRDGEFRFENCLPKHLWLMARAPDRFLDVTRVPDGTDANLGNLPLAKAASVLFVAPGDVDCPRIVVADARFGWTKVPVLGPWMRIERLPPGEVLVFGASIVDDGGSEVIQRLTETVRTRLANDRPARVELPPLR
jgi:hypothetical protein